MSKKGWTSSTTTFRTIYRLYIEPLIPRYVFSEEQLDDNDIRQIMIDVFFGEEWRSVYFARAQAPFKMPGLKWETLDTPTHFYAGTGDRQVSKGDALIVRTDIRTPDRIDIEFKDQVFMLTGAEWNAINDRIKKK